MTPKYLIKSNSLFFICNLLASIVTCSIWLPFPYGIVLLIIYFTLSVKTGMEVGKDITHQIAHQDVKLGNQKSIRDIKIFLFAFMFWMFFSVFHIGLKISNTYNLSSEIKCFSLMLVPMWCYLLMQVYWYFINYELKKYCENPIHYSQLRLLISPFFICLLFAIMAICFSLGIAELPNIINQCLKSFYTSPGFLAKDLKTIFGEGFIWFLFAALAFFGIPLELKKIRNRTHKE